MFDIISKKTSSFLALIRKNINEKYDFSQNESLLITGAVGGTLYFVNPPKDTNVKLVIQREELTHIAPGIITELPEEMYYV